MSDDRPTMLRKRGIQRRMQCKAHTAKRIEDAFVTVESLVEAVESDKELTDIKGIGPKTAEKIKGWWDNRFEAEEKMDNSTFERTGKRSGTLHFHNSWDGAIGDQKDG